MNAVTKNFQEINLFWFANLQSLIGDEIGYIALMAVAYSHLHSPIAVSSVLLADLLPAVLLGNVFGALADRIQRRTILVIADLVRAVAFLSICLFSWSFRLIVLLACLAGIGTALAQPALLSGLGLLSKPQQRASIVTTHATMQAVVRTAGPFIAAVGFVFISVKTALLINAATFIISAFIFSSMTSLGSAQVVNPKKIIEIAKQNIWRFKKTPGIQPKLRNLIILSGLGALAGGFLTVGEVAIAFRSFQNGSMGLGLLVGAYGVGMAFGAYWAKKVSKAVLTYYSIAMIVFGICLMSIGLANKKYFLLLSFLVAGLANGLTISLGRLYIYQVTRQSNVGAAFGKKGAVDSVALLTSILLAGILIHALSISGVLACAGLLLLMANLFMLIKISTGSMYAHNIN